MKLIKFSLFINTIVLVLFLFNLPSKYEQPDSHFNIFFPILIFTTILIFLISTSKYFGSIVKYDLFFLLGFAIVHFQLPIVYSLGIRNKFTEFAIINLELMNFLTWFSGVSIILWMIGNQIVVSMMNVNRSSVSLPTPILNKRFADFLLLFFFIGFITVAGKSLFSGIYDGGKSWGANAAYFFMLLRALLIVRVFYFFYSNKNSLSKKLINKVFEDKVLLFVLLSYVCIFLLSGQRAAIIELLILIACLYSVYIKKVGFGLVFISILISGALFTLLGLGRTPEISEAANNNIFERGLEKYNENDEMTLPTDELAGSNKISYLALDYFPDKIDFLYGGTFFVDIVGIIPFGSNLILGSDVHPLNSTSTLLFTYIDQGNFATFGAGSDVLSDVYINSGIYGTFLIFFLFGGIIAFIQFKFCLTKNFVWGLVASAILISAFFINRGQLLLPLKDIFYVVIFCNILIKFKK